MIKAYDQTESKNYRDLNLTLLYFRLDVVIPIMAGIQIRNTEFRVEFGIKNKGKRSLTHHSK
jgi:hypothetical protein